jgi:hypothetical protein
LEEKAMNLKRLSIGTFNLYNLNEPGLPIYSDRSGWSQAEYDWKIDWTSRTVPKLLKPDIFGFQELWHRASLARVLDASEVADQYDLLVPESADGTRIVYAAVVRKGLVSGSRNGLRSSRRNLSSRAPVMIRKRLRSAWAFTASRDRSCTSP